MTTGFNIAGTTNFKDWTKTGLTGGDCFERRPTFGNAGATLRSGGTIVEILRTAKRVGPGAIISTGTGGDSSTGIITRDSSAPPEKDEEIEVAAIPLEFGILPEEEVV